MIADAAVALLLIGGLAYAARAERRPALLWIGGGVVIGWWVLALTLAKSGFFETTPETTMPPRIGPAASIVLHVYVLARLSMRARQPSHARLA